MIEVLVVIVVVLFAIGSLSGSAGSSRRKAPSFKEIWRVDVSERTRDVLIESLQIAARTKRRDTAESRLGVAEKMLQELEASGAATDEDRARRAEIEAIRAMWAQKPKRKPRDPNAPKKPRATRKAKIETVDS